MRVTIRLLLPALSLVACSLDPVGSGGEGCQDGKCDDSSQTGSGYLADLESLNAAFPGSRPMEKIEDAFTVHVHLGPKEVIAPDHLFGAPVNVIPYSNTDGAEDASGQPLARGDAVIASYYRPGEVGFAIKHHRPMYRDLSLDNTEADMKDVFKLQDTHIEIVVGVERDGGPGAITLNNPQTYEHGFFGDERYPMIFVKPIYPDYLSEEQRRLVNENLRLMAVGFNAVSTFPGDYNGGDPLAARDPELVRQHVAQMVRALTGDGPARMWFTLPENKIYCAELAHVSASAALIVPLNAATMVPLVGEQVWADFVKAIEDHNAGKASPFDQMNENPRVALVRLPHPDGLTALLPVADSAPDGERAAEAAKLAFRPMTMSDIVEEFLRTHIPREQLGEGVAPIQGEILKRMKAGLLHMMEIDKLPADHPVRIQADALYDRIVAVVIKPYGSYQEFRAAVEPLLAEAAQLTGPRPGSGVGLFVPPSLLHVVAQGKHLGGLLRLRVVGHGLHVSQVRRGTPPSGEPIGPDPKVVNAAGGGTGTPGAGPSCADHCGQYDSTRGCGCDDGCQTADPVDCCPDFAQVCQ